MAGRCQIGTTHRAGAPPLAALVLLAGCALEPTDRATGLLEPPTPRDAGADGVDGAAAYPDAPDAGGPDAGPRSDDLELCGTVALRVRPETPTVQLVVDRSGSMAGPFLGQADRTRWAALRAGLFAEPSGDLTATPGGVVATLELDVRFGLTLFTAQYGVGCPSLIEAAPALDHASDLAGLFDASPPPMDGKTPTGEALEAVLDRLEANPPETPGPTYLVLATDGDPDRCDAPATRDAIARERAVDAVRRAFGLGFRTFVVALGRVQAEHLQALANAGVGLPAPDAPDATRAPYWLPEDADTLGAALWSAVGAGLSCRLAIDGRVDPDRACEGTLTIDGEAVACDAPGGGWRALDEGHLELLGETCRRIRQGPIHAIEATLPCAIVLR